MAKKSESNRKRRGRGEGAVYQRSDGTWCASYSAGYDQKGKRRRKTVYGKTKREVQEELRKLQSGGIPNAGKLTVAEWLDRWLESNVKVKLAPTTYARYEQVVRLHIKPHIGRMKLAAVEPLHIQHLFAVQQQEGASVRQQEHSGVVLQKAMQDAVRLRLVPYNPVRDVEKPRPEKKEMLTWNENQVGRFLREAAKDRLYAMYVLALAGGMREGELFGLEWPDIDFDKNFVKINRTVEDIAGIIRVKPPKTPKSRRRVDLPQSVMVILHEHRKRMLAEGHVAGPVFCDSEGGYLRRQNVLRRSFRKIVQRVNEAEELDAIQKGRKADPLPMIRVHDLRHSNASLLLLRNINPKVVSERLGHSTVQITLDTYSHVQPTLQREAAEKLGELFG